MDTDDPFAANFPRPTAARPLLGLTVLAVEDSRFACEALRLMCMRSGARIRRADTLRAAKRHFRVYRPTVVIIDLGLPDGTGIDLIAELSKSTTRVEAIIAISGDTHREDEALAAGADGFLAKPIASLGVFQEKILSALPVERRPSGPRPIDETMVAPDRLAYCDDMAHVAELLNGTTDGPTLDYVAQFLSGVAHLAHDRSLADAASDLGRQRATGGEATRQVKRINSLIRDRLDDQIAI